MVELGTSAVEGYGDFIPIRPPGAEDRRIANRFLSQAGDDLARFTRLFGYFVAGFYRHAIPGFARVHYPGMPSIRGHRITGLEGFARTAPLLAAWLHSGRPGVFEGRDLIESLAQGLLRGTDPASPDYWGDMADDDQRMVEAADIARTVWLSRNQLWDRWSRAERERVATWLLQVNGSQIRVRNNWLLFPDVVNAALNALGWPAPDGYENYLEFKRLHYRERGWFFDIPEGIDFYNCWGITYDLFWLRQLAPALDSRFLNDAIRQSGDLTAHLISPEGIPIMGRSVCYRTAVPVPVLAAAHLTPTGNWPGLARRALAAVWDYFVRRGVLTDGTLTMGYFGNDPRLIDGYTGPGSSHWGLRSLVLAMMFDDAAPFWNAEAESLPVERRDYKLRLPRLGWMVTGGQKSKDIVITIAGNHRRRVRLEPVTLKMLREEQARETPRRPKNHAAKYLARSYSAKCPFMVML
ncbi:MULTISPECIES: DUF2264 domain-containing protein [Asticcacaulis]|uniref:DUF2264 domain-containing protein n=1 Tax=Asticcacaulis TaxID=76890 RepID=UPI001AE11EB7|nr:MULTISPECIES: DUF2264 domain-containing protein [Asticcacaulis]MBP2157890.1 hypothetical protein [Asticcacaulis solisilvae]MDR6798935.1 hypothetical protein [Asticcacaulis sp. BE141]